MKAPINSALRSWTRGVSFTLAMGKTQVAALVCIHLSVGQKHFFGGGHRALRHFITGADGLLERGLVVHFNPGPTSNEHTIDSYWRVTADGEHVIALLQSTGIYDELREEFSQPLVNSRYA